MSESGPRRRGRPEARRRYQSVVACVRANTGPDKPLVSESVVRLSMVAHGDMAREDYISARRAAVANDDLLEYHGKLALADPASLRAVIEGEIEGDAPPRKALVARCNQLIDQAKQGAD